MKKVCVFLILLISTAGAYSQGLKLSPFYSQRELRAPLTVKNKLVSARQEIASRNLRYVVGYTSVADIPLEKITGTMQVTSDQSKKVMDSFKAQLQGVNRIQSGSQIVQRQIPEFPKPGIKYIYGDPTQSKLDLRKAGYVTPVKDQQTWGSCWAFSAMAAYESSYKIATGSVVNTSEEHVVNCFQAGTWKSGYAFMVLDRMVDNQDNVADESVIPYTGPATNFTCNDPSSTYFAGNWGLADPTRNFTYIAPVEKIKEALCKYGVISAALKADENFKLYAGGEFFSFQSNTSTGFPEINHSIAIIGWDDTIQCWLIKNSWGTEWGTECGYGTERGYMWIKYNSSNIGSQAVWVIASNSSL